MVKKKKKLFFQCMMTISATDGWGGWGGATWTVCPGPPVCGGPQTVLDSFKIRSGSSFTVQSSFFKEFILLYCWFQVSLFSCFAIYAADANFKLMHTLSYMTTAQPTSWGSLRHNFNLKLKTATWRYVCTLCIYEKEPHEPPEHTSEHVNLKISRGMPPDPPHTI